MVHDLVNRPVDAGLDCSGDPGKTQQEFAKDCDINRLMDRVLKGQQEIPPDVRVGEYGDFSDVGTFQESMELLEYARGQFAALPARVRDRFDNDPMKLLEWVHDPKTTLEEANELGLLKDEARARLAKAAELEAQKAAAAAAQPAVVVPPGGVVVSTMKTTP